MGRHREVHTRFPRLQAECRPDAAPGSLRDVPGLERRQSCESAKCPKEFPLPSRRRRLREILSWAVCHLHPSLPLLNDLQFGAFTLDLAARQLFRGDERVPLPGKTFDLLDFMAKLPGEVLTKGDLLAEVWQGAFVEEANLSQTVFLIRKALDSGGDRIVVTLPRVGYRFSETVTERLRTSSREVVPATDQSASTHKAVTMTTTLSKTVYVEEAEERIPFYRSPVVLGTLAVALLLLCVAGWLGWQRWEDHVGGPPVQVVARGARRLDRRSRPRPHPGHSLPHGACPEPVRHASFPARTSAPRWPRCSTSRTTT